MMFKTKQKIWVLFFIILSCACGTIIGNGITDPTTPTDFSGESPNGASNLDFSAPIDEYNQSSFTDCGSFTENSTVAEVDAGRQCIRDALSACTESRYLYNKHNTDESRFVSFVSIKETTPGHCLLHVHTVSDVPPDFIGDKTKTCTEIQENEIPEVACGILD